MLQIFDKMKPPNCRRWCDRSAACVVPPDCDVIAIKLTSRRLMLETISQIKNLVIRIVVGFVKVHISLKMCCCYFTEKFTWWAKQSITNFYGYIYTPPPMFFLIVVCLSLIQPKCSRVIFIKFGIWVQDSRISKTVYRLQLKTWL